MAITLPSNSQLSTHPTLVLSCHVVRCSAESLTVSAKKKSWPWKTLKSHCFCRVYSGFSEVHSIDPLTLWAVKLRADHAICGVMWCWKGIKSYSSVNQYYSAFERPYYDNNLTLTLKTLLLTKRNIKIASGIPRIWLCTSDMIDR